MYKLDYYVYKTNYVQTAPLNPVSSTRYAAKVDDGGRLQTAKYHDLHAEELSTTTISIVPGDFITSCAA